METTKERAARCDRATHARRSSSLPAYGSRTASITRRRRRAKRKALRAATLAAAVLLLGGISVAIFTTPIRLETNGITWLYILGLALPATAISNITLVKAIKLAGPTLTSLFGALEPLTAVLIGVFVFKELFTVYSAMGIALIVVSVSLVVFQEKRKRV